MTTKNTAATPSDKKGTLYIVATPIGNLGDITQRALDTLKKVDKICAEDTRNTRKLLTHFGISGDLQALHDHNERNRIDQIKGWLDTGQNIALVSDAGTPLISDPGYHLVNELGGNGSEGASHHGSNSTYRIEPIPGASAIITALSIAGLPTDRFTFEVSRARWVISPKLPMGVATIYNVPFLSLGVAAVFFVVINGIFWIT